MKILYVINEPWFFLSHRLPIALAAKQQGYTVHVATRNGIGVREIISNGFVHHEIPSSRNGSSVPSELFSLLAIWKLISNIKTDIYK